MKFKFHVSKKYSKLKKNDYFFSDNVLRYNRQTSAAVYMNLKERRNGEISTEKVLLKCQLFKNIFSL